MTKKYPAPYVVTNWLPRKNAAANLSQGQRALLRRLAKALPLSNNYTLAEIIERDNTYIQCRLTLTSDTADLAEAVGATVTKSASPRAHHWHFRFDKTAAAAIESALAHHLPSETLLHAANLQHPPEIPK